MDTKMDTRLQLGEACLSREQPQPSPVKCHRHAPAIHKAIMGLSFFAGTLLGLVLKGQLKTHPCCGLPYSPAACEALQRESEAIVSFAAAMLIARSPRGRPQMTDVRTSASTVLCLEVANLATVGFNLNLAAPCAGGLKGSIFQESFSTGLPEFAVPPLDKFRVDLNPVVHDPPKGESL